MDRVTGFIKRIGSLFYPPGFQGWGRKRRYFEGWYFKVVDADEQHAVAVIPGIAMDEDGSRQAFIQVLDGKNKKSKYHRFEYNQFQSSARGFRISIGSNSFSDRSLQLDLPGIEGHLTLHQVKPWPSKWYSPGIMGPYTFAPFMECYHGIVSMDHEIMGVLTLNGVPVSFDGGRGYIEKDWGRSFPRGYIWAQSNHFEVKGVSLKASVARIPWVTGSFTGFIAGLQIQDRLYPFASYNGSTLVRSFADEGKVELVMENKKYRILIRADRDRSTALASPILGLMDGRIEESMTVELVVRLEDLKAGRVIFEDTGRNGGLEVAGNIHEILV